MSDIDTYIAIDKKVAGRTYFPILTEEEALAEFNRCVVYMVQKDNKIVGTVSYQSKEDGSIYLSGLAVDPDYQGKGIGRLILEKVLNEIGNSKIIWLVTHPENTKVVTLYESLGFIITERKEDYFGDGEPRIVLKLNSQFV